MSLQEPIPGTCVTCLVFDALSIGTLNHKNRSRPFIVRSEDIGSEDQPVVRRTSYVSFNDHVRCSRKSRRCRSLAGRTRVPKSLRTSYSCWEKGLSSLGWKSPSDIYSSIGKLARPVTSFSSTVISEPWRVQWPDILRADRTSSKSETERHNSIQISHLDSARFV